MIFSVGSWLTGKYMVNHVPASCIGVFTACFVANATVLLPAPSIMFVVQYALAINPAAVIISGALGASMGEMTGYYLGRSGSDLFSNKLVKRIRKRFPRNPYLWVFLFAFVPLPIFDLVGLIAGAGHLKAMKFYVFCFLGKLLKMSCFVTSAVMLLKILS